MPLSFLLTSWGNPGNLNPFLTDARLLSQKGHRVRFIDEAFHGEEIRWAGFDHIARASPPDASGRLRCGTSLGRDPGLCWGR